LRTNDPGNQNVTLTLKYEYARAVSVFPTTLDFGKIEPRAPIKKTLEVRRLRGASVPKVVRVESSSPALAVRPVSEIEEPGRVVSKYEVELAPGAATASFVGTLTFLTDSPETPAIEVPVKASLDSPLTATPQLVSFGSVKAGAEATSSVRLAARKTGDAKPARAVCEDSRIALALEPQAGESGWILKVTLRPGTTTGRLKTKADVVDEAGGRLCEVPIYAVVVAGAR
jgi:hypothetical protein